MCFAHVSHFRIFAASGKPQKFESARRGQNTWPKMAFFFLRGVPPMKNLGGAVFRKKKPLDSWVITGET